MAILLPCDAARDSGAGVGLGANGEGCRDGDVIGLGFGQGLGLGLGLGRAGRTVEAALSANGTAYRTIIPRAIETPFKWCCVPHHANASATPGAGRRRHKNKRKKRMSMLSGSVGVRDTWSGVVSTDRTVQAQTKEMDGNVERGTCLRSRAAGQPRKEMRRNETEDETQNETKRPVQFTPSALHRDEIKANHKKEKEY
ncbi:hypothetical protein B0H14DRAFT_2559179 [Mycena olivaceomarginata]|nr:hypothetical protein B0H14DRAFT_2559179 [Mycena olivaceomarginata]